MLQISKKTDYGLNFLLTLAKQDQKIPLTLTKIATQNNLPRSFLSKIATRLVKAEIIKSKEGIKGGYVLARKPAEITLAKILTVLEGPTKNYCARTCNNLCGCSFCTTRDVVKPLEKEISLTLQATTLADLLGKGGEVNV